MNFFTSDPHFSHRNVIKYCARPFASSEEMDEEIIRRWNAVVGEHDQVYVLGDVFFCGKVRAKEIMDRLTGTKILIRGNHDHWRDSKYLALGFAAVHRNTRLLQYNWNLSHFPYAGQQADNRVFPEQLIDNGDWLLCGHVHTSWKKQGRMINVGMDQWNFTPVSEAELVNLMMEEVHYEQRTDVRIDAQGLH